MTYYMTFYIYSEYPPNQPNVFTSWVSNTNW